MITMEGQHGGMSIYLQIHRISLSVHTVHFSFFPSHTATQMVSSLYWQRRTFILAALIYAS